MSVDKIFGHNKQTTINNCYIEMMNAMGSPSISELQKTEDREHSPDHFIPGGKRNSQIAEQRRYIIVEPKKRVMKKKDNDI